MHQILHFGLFWECFHFPSWAAAHPKLYSNDHQIDPILSLYNGWECKHHCLLSLKKTDPQCRTAWAQPKLSPDQMKATHQFLPYLQRIEYHSIQLMLYNFFRAVFPEWELPHEMHSTETEVLGIPIL